MANKRHRLSLPELSEKLLFPRWLQDGSRMAQDGSRWPQVDQDSLLGAFLGLQTLSWKALDPQKPVKTNGLTFALPLLCLRFALVSPLLYLPFSFSFRMGGAPLSYLPYMSRQRKKRKLTIANVLGKSGSLRFAGVCSCFARVPLGFAGVRKPRKAPREPQESPREPKTAPRKP